MAKVRKMLGKADTPYIISIMQLIETQSKNTIVKWCNKYTRECKNMENELRKVAVIDESNPAKIDWHC